MFTVKKEFIAQTESCNNNFNNTKGTPQFFIKSIVMLYMLVLLAFYYYLETFDSTH